MAVIRYGLIYSKEMSDALIFPKYLTTYEFGISARSRNAIQVWNAKLRAKSWEKGVAEVFEVGTGFDQITEYIEEKVSII